MTEPESDRGTPTGVGSNRREDPDLLRGVRSFVSDVCPPGTLHAAFVRSTVPHGRISSIEHDEEMLFTDGDLGLDLAAVPLFSNAFDRPVLARGVVRYVGDPVAVVLADSPREARDRAGNVWVDFELLPVATDPDLALDPDQPVLFPEAGSNLVWTKALSADSDPLAGAEVVVTQRMVQQRLAPVPMEPSAIVAEPDGSGGLVITMGTQHPQGARQTISGTLQLDPEVVHVTVPAMGGGFGAKGVTYPEHIVVAALALELGRPVSWVETRTENLINMVHGRGQVQYAELGAKRDGRLVGLRVRYRDDAGAYPTVAASLGSYAMELSAGVYDIPVVEALAESVVTNRTPIGAYRGAGRPEGIQMIERMMDLLALELDMDPVEVRRRNLIPAFHEPHRTATGALYDSGDYEGTLDAALDHADWPALTAERLRRIEAADPVQMGIGLSIYVESNIGIAPPREFGAVAVADDGRIIVRIGGSSHGQGHATTFADLVSGRFDVSPDRVAVLQSDTRLVPEGIGPTAASRSLQLIGSSAAAAADEVIAHARVLAAAHLEASAHDLVLVPDAGLGVAGVPDSVVGWSELAALAGQSGQPLSAEVALESPGSTYAFGVHIAVVDVEIETGSVRLRRHIAFDDCGNVVNPMLAAGQVHGAVVQGIGQALFEGFRFDDDGNPLTATMVSYQIPAAGDVPLIESRHTVTPSPYNPLGAKGVAEGGTVGATPAVHSAVMDVLARRGVPHLDLPLTPARVWEALRRANKSV